MVGIARYVNLQLWSKQSCTPCQHGPKLELHDVAADSMFVSLLPTASMAHQLWDMSALHTNTCCKRNSHHCLIADLFKGCAMRRSVYLVMVKLQPCLTRLPPACMCLQVRLTTHVAPTALCACSCLLKATKIHNMLHMSAFKADYASSLSIHCRRYILT